MVAQKALRALNNVTMNSAYVNDMPSDQAEKVKIYLYMPKTWN